MRNERISLHLPESDTACPFPSLFVDDNETDQFSITRMGGSVAC
jgi:hypothetical protein